MLETVKPIPKDSGIVTEGKWLTFIDKFTKIQGYLSQAGGTKLEEIGVNIDVFSPALSAQLVSIFHNTKIRFHHLT